jgi:hypothetical protein
MLYAISPLPDLHIVADAATTDMILLTRMLIAIASVAFRAFASHSLYLPRKTALLAVSRQALLDVRCHCEERSNDKVVIYNCNHLLKRFVQYVHKGETIAIAFTRFPSSFCAFV